MLNAHGSFLRILLQITFSCVGLAGWIWAIFSYLVLGDNSAGLRGVSWSISRGEQLGELIYDAQASDEVLTLQKSIYSFLLLIFHNILGLHRVVLHAP